jgi:hypothetical protein
VKLPSLVDKVSTAVRRWVATEEQCERLVNELTLQRLRETELCMTIVGASPQAPLHEGMQFVATHYTGVVMRLSTLWVAVSLATQFVLGCLPVDISQMNVVVEMVAKFQEWAEWCLRLEGLRPHSWANE